MIRKILRWTFQLIFRLFSDVRVFGEENVPTQGGILLAVNHMSAIDPPLVYVHIPRDDASALVADKYKKNPLFNPLVRAVDGIFINREEADFKALRAAHAYLQSGGLLGIAPEGTRSHTRALIQAKTGIAYLADRAKVPVLPVAIAGTETAFEQLFRLRRPQITIQVGASFTLPPIDRRNREACLQTNTDEIMCRIATMLPPQYWGVYAGHPRLEELLANPEAPIPVCQPEDQAHPGN